MIVFEMWKICVFDEVYFLYCNCCYNNWNSLFFSQPTTIVKEINSFNTSMSQCLWLPNLARWWVSLTGSYPYSYSTLWSCGLARLHCKSKPLWFCNMKWWVPTDKITWSFDHVVWWSHMTNKIFYIYTCTRAIATNIAIWYLTVRAFHL